MMVPNTEHTWHLFGDRLYHYILKKVGQPAIADDIRQDVFLRIHEKLPQLREVKHLKSWVFAITRNAIHDYWKSGKGKIDWESDFEEPEVPEPDPDFSACLNPMLDRLPNKYKQALQLADLEGLSQLQLAEKLGISYSGAKSRVQRAREMLKTLFSECCQIPFREDGTLDVSGLDECPCCGASFG